MNASDILIYGNQTLKTIIRCLPDTAWQMPGVCGVWSAQDVIAHLASYETMLVEVLGSLVEQCRTPTLDRFLNANSTFNDEQVALRKSKTIHEVLTEYDQAHQATLTCISQISAETRRQPGVLAWYGAEYSLDDFLVYTYYGHKREHSAQIAVFCDKLAKT